mmetsp:Transcript_62032/g.122608  ORF Transcript_62032/g.122608 Transcript_62032/m.122608 type:complete len:223 (+) Transcript_62032:430-1098(+)
MPMIGCTHWSSARRVRSHARISGVSTIRSAPATAASAESSASATTAPRVGKRNVPAEARASLINFAQLCGFGRATAMTVAPHLRSEESGPRAEVAPSTTKTLPVRSTPPPVATDVIALSTPGSMQPYVAHALSCCVSASPDRTLPPYGTSTARFGGALPKTLPVLNATSDAGAAIASSSVVVLPPRTNSKLEYMASSPASAALTAASGLAALASATLTTYCS